MFRVLGLTVLTALSISPVLAQENCMPGSTDAVLSVSTWAIEPINDQSNRLTVTISNNTNKDIRMVDASVGFTDALGGRIASYNIGRDAEIKAGGTFTEDGRWGPNTFERLLALRPEETAAYVCVKSVLYEDGTKETF